MKELVDTIKKYYKLKYERWSMVGGTFREGYRECMADMEKLANGESIEAENMEFRVVCDKGSVTCKPAL